KNNILPQRTQRMRGGREGDETLGGFPFATDLRRMCTTRRRGSESAAWMHLVPDRLIVNFDGLRCAQPILRLRHLQNPHGRGGGAFTADAGDSIVFASFAHPPRPLR